MVSIILIISLPLSATYIFPDESIAIPCGFVKLANVASPLSPEYPSTSVPAIVDISPVLIIIFKILCSIVKYIFPTPSIEIFEPGIRSFAGFVNSKIVPPAIVVVL